MGSPNRTARSKDLHGRATSALCLSFASLTVDAGAAQAAVCFGL